MLEAPFAYIDSLAANLRAVEITCGRNKPTLGAGIYWLLQTIQHRDKIIFIGNGGSAAIASHMANDFAKNGKLPGWCFSDAAALSCLANDYGYEHVYAKQIETHARRGDLLVAISSSGQSQNILNAVRSADKAGCTVATFSGFGVDNPLRSLGAINFYVPSDQYGFVEIAHLTLLHMVLDIHMGWRG